MIINDKYGKIKRRRNLPENIENKYQIGIQTRDFQEYLTELQEKLKNSVYLLLENKKTDLEKIVEAAFDFSDVSEFSEDELKEYSKRGILSEHSYLYKIFLDEIKNKMTNSTGIEKF